MWRSVASNALTFFIVILIVIVGVVGWGERSYTGPGPLKTAICVRVDKGATVSGLSRELAQKGAIRSGMVFRLGAEYSGKAQDLRYGSYLIKPASSMQDILGVLTKGGQSTCGTEVNYRIGVTDEEMVVRQLDPATENLAEIAKFDPVKDPAPEAFTKAESEPDTRYRVILAEGATSWQLTNALAHAGFLSGKLAKQPDEGSVAPGSYEVTKGEMRAELVAAMQERQAQTLSELWAKRAAGLPYKTPNEALVMASLIEKETGVPSERPIIASVFLNRLKDHIRLQTDPAVIYGITHGKGTLGRGLRQSELRAATPYNTYVVEGLPPTPIANPGKAAIEAALHPANTDYLYFVAKSLDPKDGHVFAKTLAEQNRNVAKFRAMQAAGEKAGAGSGN